GGRAAPGRGALLRGGAARRLRGGGCKALEGGISHEATEGQAMHGIPKRLDGWREEQIDFLARLVNQDSGTDDKDDVNAAGEILEAPLAELGFTVTRVTQDRYGDHLVGVKPGTGPRRFLFVGHYDTVFPAGTAKERPFRIEGSRAFGPGVYDMKGGLTAL